MAGTISGAKLAAETNKKRHGDDFYVKIGALGGKAGVGWNYQGGFASEKKGSDGLTGRQRASRAGKKGGTKSRKNKS
jgi:hypothetical protein